MLFPDHPSVIAVKESSTSRPHFNFSFVEKEVIFKKIKQLQSNKSTQNTDIPTKFIIDNKDIFVHYFLCSPCSHERLN